MNKTLCRVLPVAVFLAACSGEEQPKAKSNSPFDTQIQSVEKAKQVDKLIQETDAKRRKEMEERGL